MQEVASLRDQLSDVVPTPFFDAESRLASVRKELQAASAMIGKLRAEVQTIRDPLDYNLCRARGLYSSGVDERWKAESSHRRQELAWERRVGYLESKVSAAVDAKTQTRKRNTELAVRIAGEDTRRSRTTDAWDRVVGSKDGLG